MSFEGPHPLDGVADELATAVAAQARAEQVAATDITIASDQDGEYDNYGDSVQDASTLDGTHRTAEATDTVGFVAEADVEVVLPDDPRDAAEGSEGIRAEAVEASDVDDLPPPDGGPDNPNETSGTSAETASNLGLRHVPGLRREGGDDTEVQNKPQRGAIIAAARRREPQVLTITRTQPGAARNIHIAATPSLVPPDAKKPRQGPVPDKEPQFKAWARITAVRRAPEEGKQPQPSNTDEAEGMNIEEAIKTYKGTFKLMVVGQGVEPDAQAKVTRDVGREHRRASRTHSRSQEASKLELIQNELNKAKESALVHRSVVIGVENPEDLEEVARHFAGKGFTSGDTTTWTVETEGEYGPVKEYRSAQEAIEGGIGDLDSYITADQFSQEVKYPENDIPGMTVESNEPFAANREVPSDMPSVKLGDIITDGERGEELRVTLKDLKRHTLIAASSGSGKTVLIRQIATDVIREDWVASQTPEGADKPHRAVVIIDFEKIGNYTERLADQLAGAGLPEERATVHRIAPGSEGMRANVNLLRLTGTTPSQQVNIATRSLTANITDPQAERVFSKFAGMAIARAYEKLGWNLDTDKSKYPMGTPGIPDIEQVAIAVEEIMTETTFRSETKGDLEGFTKTELEDFLRGIPGQLFTGGYDIDWTKVRENKGVTVIELGRITDPEAKRIALTAIIRGMGAALDMENPNGADTDETKLVMFMDETGGIFDEDTEAGKDNAHFFSNLRGKGAAMVMAQQGGLKKIHHDVTDSTSNVVAMQMNNPEDLAWVAERMGVPTTKVLKSVEEGGGMYYGLKMKSGPVEFATTHPKDIPPGKGVVTDARQLVDKGGDPDFYDGSTKVEARDWLIKDHTGTLVRAAAELSAGLVPMGRDPLEISGKLRMDLRDMYQGDQRKVLECSVVTAIAKAVDSRPEIMYSMTRKELTDYLVSDMMAQIAGTPRPERRDFDMQVQAGYYSAVKDAIINETTPAPLDMTPEVKRAIGRAITGRSAQEQLDSLGTLEKRSLKAVAAAITAAAANPLADTSKVAGDLRRLLGRGDPEQTAASVRNQVSKLKKELTDAEIEAFDRIVQGLRAGEEAPEMGYPEVRSELSTRIEDAKNSGAIDVSEFEELYHEDFSSDGVGQPLETSRQQLAYIQSKENAMLATSRQKVSVSNLLFAPDLIEGGLTIDRIIETLIKGNQRQGHVYDRQRRAHNDGQQEDLSLIEMFKRADPRAEEWGTRIGVEILRSSNFHMTPATAHFLARWVSDHINNLRTQAAEFLEQEASKSQRAGAGAKK